MEAFDVVVIGAGIAGLSAATAAARRGASVLVLDRLGVGGQVATVERIVNFPGFAEPVSGLDLALSIQEQAEALGAEFRLADVASLAADADRVVLDGEITARSLIYAAGSSRRPLGLDGEERLRGRGVSTCASCDGPLFAGKDVFVAGGGDSAFDEAMVLAEFASQVQLVYRGASPRAADSTVNKVRALPNVSERPRSIVDGLDGEEVLTAIRIRDLDRGATAEAAEGLFVHVGLSPATGLVGQFIETDESGRIVVDLAMRTTHPRILAAGDVRGGSPCLLGSAAGDGVAAATSAVETLL